MSSSYKAPGKAYRKGISLVELFEKFPDEDSATKWIESIRWRDGKRQCPHCESKNTYEVKSKKPLPYRCRNCKKYFTVRMGTMFAESPLPLRKWAIAIYLVTTNLKGVSSMKLHRDLDVSQPTAWFMLRRIREAFAKKDGVSSGTVEVDETYVDSKKSNKYESKKLHSGRGTIGKPAVLRIKDRDTNKVKAKVIEFSKRSTLHGFIQDNVEEGSTLCFDDFKSYNNPDGYNHKGTSICPEFPGLSKAE